MTEKEWLELVLKTSREGGFPSVGCHPKLDGTGCMYRGENGRKCAVGLLIPDEKYASHIENERACDPVVLDRLPEWCRRDVNLMTAIQSIHDHMAKSNWNHGWFVDLLSSERLVREVFESEGVELA